MVEENRSYGWLKDKYNPVAKMHKPAMKTYPDYFSLDIYLPSIRNQGGTSSCVGFGVGGTLGTVSKKQGCFKEWDSPNWIYNGARYLEGWLARDCGCYPEDAMRWVLDMGRLWESDWPFVGFTPETPTSDGRGAKAFKNAGFDYVRVADGVEGLISALAEGNPVNIGTPWPNSWGSYKDGILPEIDKNADLAGGHCFTKDTSISLLDGRERTIGQLLEEYGNNKSFWVYSCDNKGNIAAGKACGVRKTGSKKALIKIALDNGQEIKCTLNHKFLLRNGKYKKADELIVGDSLMPLYRKLRFGKYELVMNPADEKYLLTHALVASQTNKKPIFESKIVVHHKDFNTKNNSPENLEYLTWDSHTLLHQKLISERNKTPKARARSREMMLKMWEENSEKMLDMARKNREKYRERASKEGCLGFQNKEKYNFEEMGKKTGAKLRGITRTKDFKAKVSKGTKENWAATREKRLPIVMENLAIMNRKTKENGPTEKQILARRENARKLNEKRWGKNELVLTNHHVVSTEKIGYEDVYDFSVEKYHNFALSAGVFVHNCTFLYGYDRAANVFFGQNSWGTSWGESGRYKMPMSCFSVFKQMGGYDAHYFSFSCEPIIPDPIEPTPTPSDCPIGKKLAKVCSIPFALAGRRGRFFYMNPQ